MEYEAFTYQPRCSAEGCANPARYKVAAVWSDGISRELKNYGLACEDHRAHQLARARSKRAELMLAEGESVGPVALYELIAGKRDLDLPRVAD